MQCMHACACTCCCRRTYLAGLAEREREAECLPVKVRAAVGGERDVHALPICRVQRPALQRPRCTSQAARPQHRRKRRQQQRRAQRCCGARPAPLSILSHGCWRFYEPLQRISLPTHACACACRHRPARARPACRLRGRTASISLTEPLSGTQWTRSHLFQVDLRAWLGAPPPLIGLLSARSVGRIRPATCRKVNPATAADCRHHARACRPRPAQRARLLLLLRLLWAAGAAGAQQLWPGA